MENKRQDAELILKLYELRRDKELREARAWYEHSFNPQSAEDIVNLMLSGFDASAKYRMVTTYWDMAASFVNNGALDEQMFSAANGEHLVIFAKIAPFIGQVREIFGEPNYLIHLEQLVMRIPDVQSILEKRRKLMQKWAKVHQLEQQEKGKYQEASN